MAYYNKHMGGVDLADQIIILCELDKKKIRSDGKGILSYVCGSSTQFIHCIL